MATVLGTKSKRIRAALPKADLNGRFATQVAEHAPQPGWFLTIPPNATTLAGFRQWRASADFPQEGRTSFLGGEIFIDMSWERLESHVEVKTEINGVLGLRVKRKDLGKFYADGAGVVNVDANVANVPDGMFVSWESFANEKVRKVPSMNLPGDFDELEGSPDWVMEIVSESSVSKDTKKLLSFYHSARIAEYWLIDARGEQISFQILRYEPEGYRAQPEKNGWQFSHVFGASFRLARKKDRLGGWDYRLEIKEAKKR